MTPRDPVEIKATLSQGVPAALDTLQLQKGSPLRIWFLEDLTPGLPQSLPLLAAGIILRLRSRNDQDDSTVKLRPCRRSQLGPSWAAAQKKDDWEHRIEGDWTGTRHVLAVSSALTLPAGHVPRKIEAGADLGAAFDTRQLTFLDECADLKVSLAGLTALGPITATKWKDIGVGSPDAGPDGGGLKIDAERWTIEDLDFLELSIRVKPGGLDPETSQAQLESWIQRTALPFGLQGTPKTDQVLTYLASTTPPV